MLYHLALILEGMLLATFIILGDDPVSCSLLSLLIVVLTLTIFDDSSAAGKDVVANPNRS